MANFSSTCELSAARYFDANSEHETDDETSQTTHQNQPWRSYWPPRKQTDIETWLRSESPEVIIWRFNRTRPFDRPWRAWNRTPSAVKEHETRSNSIFESEHIKQIQGQSQLLSHARSSKLSPTGFQRGTFQHQSCGSFSDKSMVEPYNSLEALKSPALSPAIFHFLSPLDSYNLHKPYLSRLPSGTDLPRTNIVTESRALQVCDISGHETSFSLDDSGFQYVKCSIQLECWTDEYVCSTYIPKLEEWLSQYFNGVRIFTYAYSFRGPDSTKAKGGSIKTPFLRAHCDATEASCYNRLRLYFPDKARELMKSRVRFINIWRALSTPHQDSPLAFCDYRTVQSDDLVPADIIFPHYLDEAYEVRHNSDQRWFYKKNMENDDVVLFKLGDSASGVAPCKPLDLEDADDLLSG